MKEKSDSKKAKALKGNRSGTEPVFLSELIDAVKADLIESANKRSGAFEGTLQVDEVIVETEVVAERNIETGTGTKLLLWAKGGQKNATKHKVAIKLSPFGDHKSNVRGE